MISAKEGLILDGEGPCSRITSASPSYVSVDITITGRAAHAGVEPEIGLSSIYIAADLIQKLPQGRLDKETTFNYAEFGMIGLESCFGVVNKVLVKENGMSLKSLIEKLTVNPRKIMNLEADLFSVGCKAQITIFDPNEKWVFENKHILSKSSNSPFIGEVLIGRVKYVISKNQFFTL